MAAEFSWNVVRGSDGRMKVVECYPSLDEALAEIGNWWTENAWANFVTDSEGTVVATAIYAGDELLVACADGRQMRIGMPEQYKE